MNNEVVREWAEWLRSGTFKQGKGALRIRGDNAVTDDEWCCLGVLCELHRVRTGGPDWHRAQSGVELAYMNDDHTYPHPKVREWAGMSNEDVVAFGMRNDEGYSFEEIAHVLISHLEVDSELRRLGWDC